MKKRFSISKLNLSLVLILILTSVQGFAQSSSPFSLNESPLPAPTSPVNDYAGVLDANTKQSLESRIIAFRDKTNPKVEIAVAIVKTTGERPILIILWRLPAAGKSARKPMTTRARCCLLRLTTANISRRSARIWKMNYRTVLPDNCSGSISFRRLSKAITAKAFQTRSMHTFARLNRKETAAERRSALPTSPHSNAETPVRADSAAEQ